MSTCSGPSFVLSVQCDSSAQHKVRPQKPFISTCSGNDSGCPSPSLRGSPPSCDTFTLESSSSPQLAHFDLASPWPYALVSTWYSHCWCERAWSSPVRRIRSLWVRGVSHLPEQTQCGQNHIIVVNNLYVVCETSLSAVRSAGEVICI